MLQNLVRCSVRTAASSSRSLHRPILHRNFVSSVLLNRPLEQFTVADLKKEARSRGLSSSGNKTSLIHRIREHEKNLSSSAVAPEAVAAEVSQAPEGIAPGVPPEAAPTAPYKFHVIIPDAAYDEPEPPIQIPIVPDLWDSSAKVEQPEPTSTEEQLPKLVVVAGAETLQGGLTHNLLDTNDLTPSEEVTSSTPSTPTPPGKAGFLDDIVEDLGLPTRSEMKKGLWKIFS
ncbi:hypothetical protein VNI00_003306 [Paramarasmius palmivorus]|uniref:SAP domain-containing protein n=1 Tax=Paramarasmius palmivorus TaxID=297713 RepID=A0AAW0DSC6_9AGAR